MSWSVSEAKAKLSALLAKARRAPQVIENRGEAVAVVLSMDEYRRLTELEAQPRETPMQAWLASVERLKAGRDLSIDLPPRRLSDDRESPALGED
ncbi:MAG: type II toxin-antitoxin system Phd/YefM family antitoxin [Myxococcota bacterium]